jgi:RNA recognition motif-containing protein
VTKELWKTGEIAWRDGLLDSSYLSTNPDRITRLFCGNLNKNITEDELKAAIPGVLFIKWVTDKQTREFYGSTFIEMTGKYCSYLARRIDDLIVLHCASVDPHAAALAVSLDKSKLKGRPLKIYYCPPRPGDVWPPVAQRGNQKVGGY